MLLRTLVPAEGESPLSFLVRLADVNRVSSPIDVLRQCQNYPRNIILPALIDAHSLARANGISPIEFGDPFGVFRIVKGGEGNRSELLCGLPVSRGTLRGIKDASFCVQCVTENKTIHAVWHISNYSCCHKHGKLARSFAVRAVAQPRGIGLVSLSVDVVETWLRLRADIYLSLR